MFELVAGVSLAERLATGGALPPREALALCIQVAAAVEAAHERGIVHRDLKPANVMITPAGAAKVLDFGLSRVDAPAAGGAPGESPTMLSPATLSMAGVILGTAACMSPEQARGQAVDRRSDVWSFGCVLFECLAGRPAFAGDTVSDLIVRVLEREPEWAALPAGVTPRVRELLRRCLRKDAAAAAGRADAAGAALLRARDERDPVLGVFNMMAHFDQVRALPQFAGLIEGLWK